VKPTPHRHQKNRHQEPSAPSNVAEAVEAILKKGTVVESFTRYSPLAVELATTHGWYRVQGLDEHERGRALGQDEEEHHERLLTRQAELERMDRAGLRAELKKVHPTFKVLKKYSDDDLRNAILSAEFPGEWREGRPRRFPADH